MNHICEECKQPKELRDLVTKIGEDAKAVTKCKDCWKKAVKIINTTNAHFYVHGEKTGGKW